MADAEGSGQPVENGDLREILDGITRSLDVKSLDQLLDPVQMSALVQRVVPDVEAQYEALWPKLPEGLRRNVGLMVRRAKANGPTAARVVAECLVQRALFLLIGEKFCLDAVSHFHYDDPNGVMAITKSSSVVVAGPIKETLPREQIKRDIIFLKIPSAGGATSEMSFEGDMTSIDVGQAVLLSHPEGEYNTIGTTPVEHAFVIPASAFDIQRLRNAISTSLGSFTRNPQQ